MVTPPFSTISPDKLFLLQSSEPLDLLCMQYALRGPLPIYAPVHAAMKPQFAQLEDTAQFWREAVKGSLVDYEFRKVGAVFSVASMPVLTGTSEEELYVDISPMGFQVAALGEVQVIPDILIPAQFFYDRATDSLADTIGFDFLGWKEAQLSVLRSLQAG